MRYIKFGTYTGAENMQIDSDLLDEAIETQAQEPVFRLYAWKPRCISLGRNQKDDFIEANGVKEDVVRRLTGGRALLHDDEITYSYVTPISIIPDGETISASNLLSTVVCSAAVHLPEILTSLTAIPHPLFMPVNTTICP